MEKFNAENVMNEIRSKISNEQVSDEELTCNRFVSYYHTNFVRRIQNASEIVIFGAGNYGKKVLKELKKDNICNIKCICDNNKFRYGTDLEGVEIISPEKAFKMYKNAVYIITVIDFPVEITAQLLALGVKVENIIYYNYAKSNL